MEVSWGVFNILITVEPPNKGHVGDNINSAVLSLIERLSSLRGSKCTKTIRHVILGPRTMSIVERLCPGSTIGGSTAYLKGYFLWANGQKKGRMELLIIPEGGEDLKVLNLQHFQCNYGQNSELRMDAEGVSGNGFPLEGVFPVYPGMGN